MLGTFAGPQLSYRIPAATVGALAAGGISELVVLVGWVAGAFMAVAIAATLYFAVASLGDEGHRPAGLVEEPVGGEPPTDEGE